MELEKLNRMIEQDVELIKNTKIITIPDFQFTIGNDLKTLYIDNITEEDKPITDVIEIIREYVGSFIISLNLNILNPEDILILEFDEEFNEEEIISAIKQIELLNNNEEIYFNKIENPEILF